MPKTIQVNPEVILLTPDADRDAPFAHQWFTSEHGKETLLLMGNVEHRITDSTLEKERETIKNFLELERSNAQLTWAIRYGNETIGAVWLELIDAKYVKSPALHIMIGSVTHRGKGIGKAVMLAVIAYIKSELRAPVLYTRHLASNTRVAKLNESLGFKNDGGVYSDSDGLKWQNDVMPLGVSVTDGLNGV